jgi:hypothetical protein
MLKDCVEVVPLETTVPSYFVSLYFHEADVASVNVAFAEICVMLETESEVTVVEHAVVQFIPKQGLDSTVFLIKAAG